MRRFQNILYIARGGADGGDALRQALTVARKDAAELHAAVISPTGYEVLLADGLGALISRAQAELHMDQDEVSTRVEVESGDSPEVRIVRRVLRNAHDLIVKQVEPGGGGFRSLDMQLLRLCPCPLWICCPTNGSLTDVRVAVAVNPQSSEPAGRDLAVQLLQMSRSLADRYGGDLNIISCWNFEFEEDLRHSPWMKISEQVLRRNVDAAEQSHRAALDKLIQESGIAGSVRVHHLRGRPEEAIARWVDAEGIDVLVMGTVGRTGLPQLVIGNTAEKVLRQIRCSLLAMKPNGFVSPVRAYG